MWKWASWACWCLGKSSRWVSSEAVILCEEKVARGISTRVIWVMIVVVIDQSLEIANLYLLVSVMALHKAIQLNHGETASHIVGMILEKLLDNFIWLELIWSDTENLKGLLLGNESPLDAQTLLSDLFSALIAKLFHLALHSLLVEILSDLIESLWDSKRPNERFQCCSLLLSRAYILHGLLHPQRGLGYWGGVRGSMQ